MSSYNLRSTGEVVISPKVRDAAKTLLSSIGDYGHIFGGDDRDNSVSVTQFAVSLRLILDSFPAYATTTNPDLLLSAYYCGDYGDYDFADDCKMSVWAFVVALEHTFLYSELVGEYTEQAVGWDEISVKVARIGEKVDDWDKNMDIEDSLKDYNKQYNKKAREELEVWMNKEFEPLPALEFYEKHFDKVVEKAREIVAMSE